MNDRNVVGIMFKSPEDFMSIKRMIGSIYDTMNHPVSPSIEQTDNHIVGKLDLSLIALIENPSPTFLGKLIMGSKYKDKHKKTERQSDIKRKAFSDKHAYCSNCGRKSGLYNDSIVYSKCGCGGTYQSFGFST